MPGFALRMASGGRRLTVHCLYCGAVMSCPPENNIWGWLKKDDVQEFYRTHRDHAGAPPNIVGAVLDFDDGQVEEQEKEELPTMVNLLDMSQRRASNV